MARRATYICECAWNKCSVRSYKEPRYCICEYQSRAVNWICTRRSRGQQALEVD